MARRSDDRPSPSGPAETRRSRVADALRANLRRRKAVKRPDDPEDRDGEG